MLSMLRGRAFRLRCTVIYFRPRIRSESAGTRLSGPFSCSPPVLMPQGRRVAPPSIMEGPTPSGPVLCGFPRVMSSRKLTFRK